MHPSPITLVHLCSADDWRFAESRGEHRPATLGEIGFIHLSTPEQVHLPANRLYAGRTDLVLLEIDRGRLDCRVVDENLEGGIDAWMKADGPLAR